MDVSHVAVLATYGSTSWGRIDVSREAAAAGFCFDGTTPCTLDEGRSHACAGTCCNSRFPGFLGNMGRVCTWGMTGGSVFCAFAFGEGIRIEVEDSGKDEGCLRGTHFA